MGRKKKALMILLIGLQIDQIFGRNRKMKLDKIETIVFCYYLQFDSDGIEDYIDRLNLKRVASQSRINQYLNIMVGFLDRFNMPSLIPPVYTNKMIIKSNEEKYGKIIDHYKGYNIRKIHDGYNNSNEIEITKREKTI